MSKRLQVILQDHEYRELQRAAKAKRITIAAWVRDALQAAHREEPLANVAKKLAAVRLGARHNLPTSDIDDMLSDIERGYISGAMP